ncbi:MAG: pilus assembly protein [Proteobacteria bacterium]|nr:pilus assembly protein [Pseudomonadota bacterium]
MNAAEIIPKGGAVLKNDKRKTLKLSLITAALAALPLVADAAGLGRLTVLSALGQPLRAELDISAAAEESNSLSARVAPVEMFRQANIEYATVLGNLRFTLDKRANGQPYFKVSSDRPVNDPFLDFLVELSWSSGRLIREYTFLLDPPEMAQSGAATSPAPAVNVPDVRRSPVPLPAGDAGPSRSVPRHEAGKVAAVSPAGKSTAKAGGETREVHRGDTLGKIAAATRPDGVSLDQMLVALFRGNPDAFEGGNMNRLKAGRILSVPDAQTATSVTPDDAHKTVMAQSADFEAYRRKLASAAGSAPAREAPAQQATSGRITPKVEDKAAVPGGKDRLEVSRTQGGKNGVAGGGREEARIVQDKALKDAQSRITELEKSLADMKKLAELKSAAGAKIQQQAETAKATPATKAQVPPVAGSQNNGAGKPAEPAKAGDHVSPPAIAAKPAEPAKPVEAPKPRKPVSPPPISEPGFIEENKPLVYGGGGLLALLAGYLGFRAWRSKRKQAPYGTESVLYASSSFSPVSKPGDDAGAHESGASGFSEAVAGAEAEAVDPLQEAETYLAYGRDSQAEEILLDALKKDPSRLEVHSKLLEIYAARRSTAQFNTVAADLKAQTGGVGPEWEKAVALGTGLDPSHHLYGKATAVAAAVVTAAAAAAIVESSPTSTAAPAVSQETPIPEADTAEAPEPLDFDLGLDAPEVKPEAAPAVTEAAKEIPPEAQVSPAAQDDPLDFDLDLGASAPVAPAPAAEPESAPAAGGTMDRGLDFDFDLGTPMADSAAVETVATAAPSLDEGNTIDFDIGGDAPAPAMELPALEQSAPEVPAPPAAGPAGEGLDFDFDLDLGDAPQISDAAQKAPVLDLTDINLDLPQSVAAVTDTLPSLDHGANESDDSEAATKLELAQAYEDMGDLEGARDLLQEVINEGSSNQKNQARDRLAKLGG